MTLNTQQLKTIMPGCDAGAWVEPLTAAMARFAIDTPQRMAAFLAQVAHESAETTRLEENLNYSAQRAHGGLAQALPYAGCRPALCPQSAETRQPGLRGTRRQRRRSE